jgi:hypothetical protein
VSLLLKNKRVRKYTKVAVYLFAGIASFLIGQKIFIGAAYNWTFDVAGDYTISDATKLEIVTVDGGRSVARLKPLVIGTYPDVIEGDFDNASPPDSIDGYYDSDYVTDHVELEKFTAAAQTTESTQTPAPYDVTNATLTEIVYQNMNSIKHLQKMRMMGEPRITLLLAPVRQHQRTIP